MNTSTGLFGKTILITRPLEQAGGLSELVRSAGGVPLVFPVIVIKPPANPAHLEELLDRLAEFDIAIFVSPTAVTRAWDRIVANHSWPENLKVAAVGLGSARALHERGITEVIAPPKQSDSESLLALPPLMDVSGKRIVIFRGEGGREFLAQTLTQRGAHVEYAECYRRAKPDADIGPLLQQQKTFSAIVLTSRESLDNLREMLGTAWSQFRSLPAFVPHERIAAACLKAGMETVEIAPGGDAGMTQAMIKFFNHE